MVDYTKITGGNYQEWLKDPDDEPVLAAALVGKAHYIVLLNTRDFPPQRHYAGVQFVSPTQFLEELYRQYPRRRLHEAFAASGYRLP